MNRAERTTVERDIRALHKGGLNASTDSNSAVVNFEPTKKIKDNLIQSFLYSVGKSQSQPVKNKIILTLSEELSTYRSLAIREYNNIIEGGKSHNPMVFWKANEEKLKFLYTLARKYLLTPATSVPSESTFSVAASLGRKERSRLDSQSLAQLVFLKDKIIEEVL